MAEILPSTQADATDATFEYTQTLSDGDWGDTPWMRRWDEIENNLIEMADETLDLFDDINPDFHSAIDILRTGSLDGQRIDLPLIYHPNKYGNEHFPSGGTNVKMARVAYRRRIILAYLALRRPDDFRAIVDNGVVLAHGTEASTLPNILEQKAILSHREADRRSILIGTGEYHSRMSGFKRDFISFGDSLSDMPIWYADRHKNKEKERAYVMSAPKYYPNAVEEINNFEMYLYELSQQDTPTGRFIGNYRNQSFGVVLGLSVSGYKMASALRQTGEENLNHGKLLHVTSDTPEVGIERVASLDYIPVVGVDDENRDTLKILLEARESSLQIFSLTSLRHAINYSRDVTAASF